METGRKDVSMVTGASADHENHDPAAGKAGKLLLLTAAASMVMVAARVAADADQPTLTESLRAIADSRPVYSLNGAARLLSALALIASAWYLLRTWFIRTGSGARLVPYLLAASGAVTLLSGVCSLILASYSAPEGAFVDGASPFDIPAFVERVSDARWLTGKIGFTLAGLALILAAKDLWQVGGKLRMVALASAVIGVAMQFIWVDAATIMHRIVGAAFFAWLIVVGAMLATGRTEKLFVNTCDRPPEAA
jgi:hypothetical protein